MQPQIERRSRSAECTILRSSFSFWSLHSPQSHPLWTLKHDPWNWQGWVCIFTSSEICQLGMRLVRDDREAKRFWTCRVETRASPASVHSFCYPVTSCLFWLLTQRCHFALIEAEGSEGDWGISRSCLLCQKEPALSHVGAACQSHQKMISCPCNVMLVVPRTAVSVSWGWERKEMH